MESAFSVGRLGGRALCSVTPARVAVSSLTYAERSASTAPGARGMCGSSYQNESDMKKSEMFRIAAKMKALEGMLK
jgi:hypothetical protein